jgi:hypothetical protein
VRLYKKTVRRQQTAQMSVVSLPRLLVLSVVLVGGMSCFFLLHRQAIQISDPASSYWMAFVPEERKLSKVGRDVLRTSHFGNRNESGNATNSNEYGGRLPYHSNDVKTTTKLPKTVQPATILKSKNGRSTILETKNHQGLGKQKPDEEWGKGDEDSFGACLLIMDDNHYLIEWLAYHFVFLPLKWLIVAVDPKSTTDPNPILDRYRTSGLMNITVWNDTNFFPGWRQKGFIASNKTIQMYLRRQEFFNVACLREMKRMRMATALSAGSIQNKFGDNPSPIWVAIVDTDEYITVNHQASEEHRVRDLQPTLHRLLNSPKNRYLNRKTDTPCIPLYRLQMATTESKGGPSEVQQWVPTTSTTTTWPAWNGTDFLTLRYRYTRNPNELHAYIKVKNVLDVARVSDYDLRENGGNGNPHRPIRTNLCPRESLRQSHQESPYLVHHYPGTYEQFTYRHGKEERTVRSKQRYSEHNYTYQWSNNNARHWLERFIEIVGPALAHKLLEGLGRIEK